MALPAIIAGSMIAGGLLNKGGRGGGNAALEAALREFGNIKAPTAEEMKVTLERMVQQGMLAPEQAQALTVDGSAFEDISSDPRLRAAQMRSLLELQGVGEDGITPIEKAAIRDIQDEMETSSRGDQMAIIEDMKRRGMYGGGLEFVNRSLANQGAASRASRAGLQVAADARKRALEAMMASGNLAGNIRGQDFDTAARKAAAVDEIRKFNVGNRQNVINANVDRRNRAGELNLAEKQRIADTNTQNQNENMIRNADLKQREFENKMNIARGKTGQLNTMAQLEEERRKNKDAFNATLIGTGGQILANSGK